MELKKEYLVNVAQVQMVRRFDHPENGTPYNLDIQFDSGNTVVGYQKKEERDKDYDELARSLSPVHQVVDFSKGSFGAAPGKKV